MGDRVKEEKFIRALATAVFEDSINNKKLVPDRLYKNQVLFNRFVDNDAKYELQCLFALQALIHKLEHPQGKKKERDRKLIGNLIVFFFAGLLLSICDKLYNDTTFSQESFNAWQDSTDPAEQEGKGNEFETFPTVLKPTEIEFVIQVTA